MQTVTLTIKQHIVMLPLHALWDDVEKHYDSFLHNAAIFQNRFINKELDKEIFSCGVGMVTQVQERFKEWQKIYAKINLPEILEKSKEDSDTATKLSSGLMLRTDTELQTIFESKAPARYRDAPQFQIIKCFYDLWKALCEVLNACLHEIVHHTSPSVAFTFEKASLQMVRIGGLLQDLIYKINIYASAFRLSSSQEMVARGLVALQAVTPKFYNVMLSYTSDMQGNAPETCIENFEKIKEELLSELTIKLNNVKTGWDEANKNRGRESEKASAIRSDRDIFKKFNKKPRELIVAFEAQNKFSFAKQSLIYKLSTVFKDALIEIDKWVHYLVYEFANAVYLKNCAYLSNLSNKNTFMQNSTEDPFLNMLNNDFDFLKKWADDTSKKLENEEFRENLNSIQVAAHEKELLAALLEIRAEMHSNHADMQNALYEFFDNIHANYNILDEGFALSKKLTENFHSEKFLQWYPEIAVAFSQLSSQKCMPQQYFPREAYWLGEAIPTEEVWSIAVVRKQMRVKHELAEIREKARRKMLENMKGQGRGEWTEAELAEIKKQEVHYSHTGLYQESMHLLHLSVQITSDIDHLIYRYIETIDSRQPIIRQSMVDIREEGIRGMDGDEHQLGIHYQALKESRIKYKKFFDIDHADYLFVITGLLDAQYAVWDCFTLLNSYKEPKSSQVSPSSKLTNHLVQRLEMMLLQLNEHAAPRGHDCEKTSEHLSDYISSRAWRASQLASELVGCIPLQISVMEKVLEFLNKIDWMVLGLSHRICFDNQQRYIFELRQKPHLSDYDIKQDFEGAMKSIIDAGEHILKQLQPSHMDSMRSETLKRAATTMTSYKDTLRHFQTKHPRLAEPTPSASNANAEPVDASAASKGEVEDVIFVKTLTKRAS